MTKEIKKIIAFFAALGCISTLFSGTVAKADVKSAKSIFLADENKITAKKAYRAVDTAKAEYLGLGRFYPFLAADKTGELYYFTTSADRAYYQIKAFVTAGAGFQIELYDETGSVLAAETELGDMEYQRFALEPEKTYYLRLSGSSDAAGNILVSEVTDDYSGEPEQAKEISFGTEYAVTAECEGDQDYLKFTTSKEDVTYTLHIDPAAGIASAYELLDEAGEKLEDFCGVTDQQNELSLTLTLEPEKTYYLKFSSEETYCQLLFSISEKINTYKLTYHLDGGKNSKENPSTYVATDKIALKNPTKKGYLFEGWFSFSDFTGEFSGIDGQGKKDYELYAKWRKVEPATVTVKTFTSNSVGKASLVFEPVSESDGYQISITRTVNKKKVVKTQTTKSTAINFKNWAQGKKYSVKVRTYIIDSCGNRVYGAYSKTKSVTVKKKVVKKKK